MPRVRWHLALVWRSLRGNVKNPPERELHRDRFNRAQVTEMNGIERSAKDADAHRDSLKSKVQSLRFCLRPSTVDLRLEAMEEEIDQVPQSRSGRGRDFKIRQSP